MGLLGRKILVADDDAYCIEIVQTILQISGAEVVTVGDGAAAVEAVAAAETPFDAVVMDIRMPRVDGLQATRRIRNLQGRGNIPIIALTAFAMSHEVKICIKAGIDRHLAKPINVEQFLHTLDDIMQKPQARCRRQSPPGHGAYSMPGRAAATKKPFYGLKTGVGFKDGADGRSRTGTA